MASNNIPNKKFCDFDTEEINTGYTMTRSDARETLRQAQHVKGSYYWLSRREVETAKKVVGVD